MGKLSLMPIFLDLGATEARALCYVMRNLFIIGSLQFCNDSTIASLEANQNRPYISQMLRYILQIGKIFLLSMWNIP